MFLLIFADFGTNFADFETRFAYFESQFPKICSRLFNEFKALKSNERSQYGSPVAGWMRSKEIRGTGYKYFSTNSVGERIFIFEVSALL